MSRPQTRPPVVPWAVAALLALLLWAAIGAGGARAASSVCGGTGAAAGECNDPRGVATDFETGRVYVAERGNDRISVFSAEGDFEFAFGWEVDAEEPKPELQSCTAAGGCRAGTAGSKAGQLLNPTNIAIDNSATNPGEVYVTTSDFRVNHFDAEGNFVNAFGWGVDAEEPKVEPQSCDEVTGCLAGIKGVGECQLGDSGNGLVDPVAVGPAGNVYVLDSFGTTGHFTDRVVEFSPAGECLGETVVASEVGFGKALAIDSGGDAWVILEGVSERLRHYELGSDEAPLCFVAETIQPKAITLDDEGRLFAAQFEPRASDPSLFRQVITEYDSACQPQHRFGYGETTSPGGATGLAITHGTAGEPLFVSEGSGFGFTGIVSALTIPPPGPLLAPGVEADPHSVWAQIDAEANPEGKATGYRVEYVEKATYEAEGFEGPATKTSGEGSLEGEGFSIAAIQTVAGCKPFSEAALLAGECLQPETAYTFRVVVESSDGEATQTGEFQTLAPLEIEATFATQVGTDGGRLEAIADPHGSPATGYFEYVSRQDFEESGFAEATRLPDTEAGEAPLDFGSGEAGVRRAAALGGLPEGASYRYRVVLSDPFGTFEGPVRSFTTLRAAGTESCPNDAYRSGAGALLPDCRAHELVSPLDKDGGDIALVGGTSAPTPGAAVLNQSSLDGNKLAYGSYRAFGDAASAPYTVSYIARRGAAGWSSHGADPQAGKLLQVEFEPQLRALSDDLCQGWLKTFYDPPLTEDAVAGYPNLYRFEDPLCGPPAHTALTTVRPAGIAGASYKLELQGHSAEGDVAAFAARGSLAGSGSPSQPCKSGGAGCRPALYVQGAEGGPRFACVLPGGGPSTGECSAGTSHGAVPGIGEGRRPNLRNALSEDGSRLYWTNSIGEGEIYLRENPGEPQSALLHGSATGKGDLRVEADGTYGAGSTSISYSGATGTFTAGAPIEGPGIPAGATIAARTPSTLTISAPTTEAKTNVKVGSGPRTISNLSTASGAFAAGQRVRGTGVPVGATIESTGAGFLVLSDDLTKSAKEVALESFSECTEADKACTTSVSEGGEALSGAGRSRFWAAAGDGSRVLYTSSAKTLNQYEAGLYEYDAETDTTTPIAGQAGGLLGASEDARRAYFTSKEALTGGEENGAGETAVAGAFNVYLRESGEGGASLRFVVQLGAEEANPGPALPSNSTAVAFEPLFHSARVSPDGLHAAFMSARPLTGYDSTDAASGEADAEVFLYDATANKLICASCNPSGARPAGINLGSSGQPLWAAARLQNQERSLYEGRTMAGDGSRLYFESQDALVARDTNSRLDVYQWEAPGAGSCTSGSPAYSPQNEGCVSLISSGQSERDSELIDVSPSGDDVFFATLSSLVSSDPGLVDIYDARIQGGFPSPPPTAAGCEGESCQSPAPAPRAPAPASLSFRGPGDLAAVGRCARPARRARALSRRARRLRRGAGRSRAARRRQARAARRSAHRARRLSANAKRCRARARAARRSQR